MNADTDNYCCTSIHLYMPLAFKELTRIMVSLNLNNYIVDFNVHCILDCCYAVFNESII